MIYFQSREANHRDSTSLPYALDRKPGDLTLADITRGAIDFLMKKNPSKFFCMIEAAKSTGRATRTMLPPWCTK